MIRGVGAFKYWKLSNLPLFLLAAPMLYIMFVSGLWAGIPFAWDHTVTPQVPRESAIMGDASDQGKQPSFVVAHSDLRDKMIRMLAIPQSVLAIMALTTYNVQIITRLSSGYPVWYWWLAYMIVEDRQVAILRRKVRTGTLVVRWMVMYAIIQGGLFASFLPPA